MATISENLLALNEAKALIKSAIESKGQNLTDVPFIKYADKIEAIEGGSGGVDNLQYVTALGGIFKNAIFPPNYEFVAEFNTLGSSYLDGLFMYAQNLKSIKLVNKDNKDLVIDAKNFIRQISAETLDLTEFNRKFKDVSWFALSSTKLKSIYGALDFTECTAVANWLNSATSLEDIEFVQETIKITIDFYWCTKLTRTSIKSIIYGLSKETSDLTVSLSLTAVNKAFETIEGAGDGSNSTEWQTLTENRTNWTINLV